MVSGLDDGQMFEMVQNMTFKSVFTEFEINIKWCMTLVKMVALFIVRKK